MKAKIKASRIHDLQDARYCAAMGIEIMSFSVIDSDTRRLKTEQIHEVVEWLSGPEVAIECDAQSWNKCKNLKFPFAWLSIPVEDCNQVPPIAGLIVRWGKEWTLEKMQTLLGKIQSQGRDARFEIEATPAQAESLGDFLPNTILCFDSLSEIQAWKQNASAQPYAFALPESARDEEGFLDYEALDAVLEEEFLV